MKIYLGADHGGFKLKEEIKKWLIEKKFKVEDVGAVKLDEEDDFVDYAELVANEVAGTDDRGILFCRNGFGMTMAANRFTGVRCGIGVDVEMIKKGRSDDDINCLSIPADYIDLEKTKKIIDTFLTERFSEDERYKRRLYKLEMLGSGCCGGGCGNC